MQKTGKIIKSLLVLVVFLLAGLLFFRLWLNGYYPREMRTLLPTEPLQSAYAKGELSVKTQDIRVVYEDRKEGLFFAEHMLVSEETGSLQVTVRWNNSTLTKLAEKYGDAFSPDAADPFTYRIFCASEAGENVVVNGKEEIHGTYYTPHLTEKDGFLLYSYERLAFEGVRLDGVRWVRLDIYRTGAAEPEGSIVIYENHEDYATFEDYKIKKGELD